MAHEDSYDWIDGRMVPQLVIDRDHVMIGTHAGTVRVRAGRFTLAGTIQGTLEIQRGLIANVAGTQQGTVSVGDASTVTVTGAIEGTATVARGGTLVVEPGGKLAGTLHNDGLVIVRGVFGGAQSGTGKLCLEGQGWIKEPIMRDGVACYEW
jgi:cytoskeletal protein CcmA (bactofilin family)